MLFLEDRDGFIGDDVDGHLYFTETTISSFTQEESESSEAEKILNHPVGNGQATIGIIHSPKAAVLTAGGSNNDNLFNLNPTDENCLIWSGCFSRPNADSSIIRPGEAKRDDFSTQMTKTITLMIPKEGMLNWLIRC
ncbi:unnamed protein product, partial [Clonostachys solani]